MNAKRLVMSVGTLVFAAAVVAGGTGAFFSDTEESVGNVFAAGSVTLAIEGIQHDYYNNDDNAPVWATENQDGFSFSLTDLKPLDEGGISYDLVNGENEAYVCAMVEKTDDDDNTVIDPELDLSDDDTDGELDDFLSFRMDGETGLLADAVGEWASLGTIAAEANVPAAFEYCFGEYDDQGACVLGDGEYNLAQTDKLGVDIKFYAVQTRNNPDFDCAQLNVEETYTSGWASNASAQDWFTKVREGGNNFELAVGVDPNSASGQDTEEATWVAATEYDFVLFYDHSDGKAYWTVTDNSGSAPVVYTTEYVVGPDSFSNLGITAKAQASETTTVDNLSLDVYALGQTSVIATGGNQSLSVTGLDLAQDWTLTGTFEFSGPLTATNPNEGTAVQISVN